MITLESLHGSVPEDPHDHQWYPLWESDMFCLYDQFHSSLSQIAAEADIEQRLAAVRDAFSTTFGFRKIEALSKQHSENPSLSDQESRYLVGTPPHLSYQDTNPWFEAVVNVSNEVESLFMVGKEGSVWPSDPIITPDIKAVIDEIGLPLSVVAFVREVRDGAKFTITKQDSDAEVFEIEVDRIVVELERIFQPEIATFYQNSAVLDN